MLKDKFISHIQKMNLDINRPIVVAMSGGIDSSFIASLLSLMGYEVIGITLKLYDSSPNSKSCCSGKDINDARMVAEQIGFKHYTLNYVSKFKQSVIDDFISSYMRGETPIPCIKCNKEVKFNDLLKTAKSLKAQCLVTGHYVIKKDNKLYKAIDKDKDQSYFLFNISQEELLFLEFPLGYFTKQEVRQCAKEISLHIADKKDSQDICFVQGDYRDLLPAGQEGNIISKSGEILGKHNGIANFTIGQKRKLNLNIHKTLYVIDFKENNVIVGEYEDLLCSNIKLHDMNLFINETNIDCSVKVRYAQECINATIKDNIVQFKEPIIRPAPGQACVFYKDDCLLGGGWIS